jgi:hypothetical protein
MEDGFCMFKTPDGEVDWLGREQAKKGLKRQFGLLLES